MAKDVSGRLVEAIGVTVGLTMMASVLELKRVI